MHGFEAPEQHEPGRIELHGADALGEQIVQDWDRTWKKANWHWPLHRRELAAGGEKIASQRARDAANAEPRWPEVYPARQDESIESEKSAAVQDGDVRQARRDMADIASGGPIHARLESTAVVLPVGPAALSLVKGGNLRPRRSHPEGSWPLWPFASDGRVNRPWKCRLSDSCDAATLGWTPHACCMDRPLMRCNTDYRPNAETGPEQGPRIRHGRKLRGNFSATRRAPARRRGRGR